MKDGDKFLQELSQRAESYRRKFDLLLALLGFPYKLHPTRINIDSYNDAKNIGEIDTANYIFSLN